ncbi:MAG: hypothetical protein IKK24_03180, partial [Clostridia bacterium]|nr:hypothetical protein [Clostridia bacterium]
MKKILSIILVLTMIASLFVNTGVVFATDSTTVATIGEVEYTTLADAVAAATAGQTVKLVNDTEITTTIVIDKKITLNLGTSTITATGCHALTVRAGGNITINADAVNPGGITSNKNAIYAAHSDSAGAKTIVINGGVYKGSCTFNPYGSSGAKAQPLSVTINGGHFKNGITVYRCYYFTANGGTFDGSFMIGAHSTCKTYFKGGLYKSKPTAQADKVFVQGVWYKEGAYNRLAANYDACEAIIGTNYYRYLSDALTAADGVVDVLKDLEVQTPAQIALGKTVNLNLNNYAVTGTVAELAGTLSVAGTLADGAVVAAEGYEIESQTADGVTTYNAVVPGENAQAKLDGVYYVNANDAIKAAGNGSVVELYGAATQAKTLAGDTTLTIIYGENASYDDSLITAAKGFKIERNPADGGTTVTYKAVFDVTQYEAEVDGTYYLTISQAFAAVDGTEGKTVTVLKDISSGGYIVNRGASFTLDLNGHTVKLSSSGGSAGKAFQFTVTDTTAEGNGVFSPSSLSSGKIVSIEGGSVITKSDITTKCEEGYASIKQEDGTYKVTAVVASVDGVYYETLAEAWAALQDGSVLKLCQDITTSDIYTLTADKNITLDLNGKTITATDNKASGNYELFYNYGGITVTGNGTITLTAETDRAWNASSSIFHNRGGVLVIENGTFIHNGGTSMAYVIDNSGNSFGDATTTVKDGTLTSAYITIRNRMDTYGENGGGNGIPTLNIEGGSLSGKYAVWGQVSSNGAKGAINITGGTFTAAEGRAAVLVDTDANPTGEINTAISGGTFSSDVSEFCAEGFTCEQNADGTYGIIVDETVWVTKGASIKNLNPKVDGKILIMLLVGIDSLDYKAGGFEVSVDGSPVRKID